MDGSEFRVQREQQGFRALTFLARSSKASSGVNTTAAFGAVVNVAPSRPTMGTACAIPGVSSTIFVILRATSSVRAERGAGRKLNDIDEIALVLLRDESGRRLERIDRR